MAAQIRSAANGSPRFGGADQVSQGLFRAALQLSPEEELDEASPPPGRELEISIEADQGSAGAGRSQSYVLTVDDPKWKSSREIDPLPVRVDAADFEGETQPPP